MAPLRHPKETGPAIEGEASGNNAALQGVSGTSPLQAESSDHSSGLPVSGFAWKNTPYSLRKFGASTADTDEET